MIFHEMSVRVRAVADYLAAKGDDVDVLRAASAFLAAFGDVKPAEFFTAAEQTVSGAPLPELDDAVLARAAAAELRALAPLFSAWKASKASDAVVARLVELFNAHPDWSLRSIQILVQEQLKRGSPKRAVDAA